MAAGGTVRLMERTIDNPICYRFDLPAFLRVMGCKSITSMSLGFLWGPLGEQVQVTRRAFSSTAFAYGHSRRARSSG